MTQRGYIPRVRNSEFNPYKVYQFYSSDDTPEFPFHMTLGHSQDKHKWSYQLPTWATHKQTDRHMLKGKGRLEKAQKSKSITN